MIYVVVYKFRGHKTTPEKLHCYAVRRAPVAFLLWLATAAISK